ncbi:MAG: peptidoglycan DD-metalloendopeptidase family protein [Elainellaceae cyanobacterium]
MHPVHGVLAPHYGVDVETPTGTKVMAPTSVSVECWWDSNGGGEVATVTASIGEVHKLLHLSSCANGTYGPGETFARTGASGIGTGPHLDVRRGDKAEPTKEEVEPFLTGELVTSYLSDQDIVCTIGAAEGTRNNHCQTTNYYNGHTDPGNGAQNLGTFSYQYPASSPADADRQQLRQLRGAEKTLQTQAIDKWGQPLSKTAMAAALDLWNQSPAAGEDFVHHLPRPTPTAAEIIAARSKSYVDPVTGQLDAPGLGSNPTQVEQDQARRTGAVLKQLEKRDR